MPGSGGTMELVSSRTTNKPPSKNLSFFVSPSKRCLRLVCCLSWILLNGGCDPRSIISSQTVATASTPPVCSLLASPSSLTLDRGADCSTTITVGVENGFSGDVTLSAVGLPDGIIATFAPVAAGERSTLSLTSTEAASAGVYSITIVGLAGNLQESTAVTVTLLSPPAFSLSASPNSLTFDAGSGISATIAVGAENGFSGNVTLSAVGLPNGILASFSPTMTGKLSTLSLTSTDAASAGAYQITVNGTAGAIQASTVVAVTVNSPPGFSLL